MKIVIVEDNTLLAENLRLILGMESGITVAGTFGTAEEALVSLKDCSPDIVLVDLGLPGMSGIELIRAARDALPELEIMAYTVFEDRQTIFAALKAGATGYILKGCTPRELIEALFNLHRGGAPMSPKVARLVIRELQGEETEEANLLSRREQEILGSLGRGLTYKEVAVSLHISPHTVHAHIKKIYGKLQAKDRRQALRKAGRKGLL
ncbi:MAG: response regulator transcription factor [Syntrophobacteraceae bacterium]|nr:response regulator transcription factor [Syntrophobacteraceae bacterium]